MNNKFFLQQDFPRIKAAVAEAESGTSGEIVPVVAVKSVHYGWLVCFLAIVGLAAGTATGIWLHHFWPYTAELSTIFALQGAGLVLGALIGRSPAVMRVLLGNDWMAHGVFESAQLAFLREGLFNTRDRTGILIFVSLREHRVVILADKGINEKVAPGYWDAAVNKIIAGIGSGTAGDSMVEVIGEMGRKLGEHFPRKGDDKNELPDDVRLQ